MFKTKKLNLIVTSAILALALVVAIITGIQFSSFRNYEAEFIVREDVVDDVIKFSEYSPNLKGTAGDSTFYAIYGTENTVAVVAKAQAGNYTTLQSVADATICYVAGQTQQRDAAAATLGVTLTNEVATAGNAVAGVRDGVYGVAIMRYQDAKDLCAYYKDVVIADVEVEKVPSLLVLGGTHPNEPSGQLTATIFLENALVQRGKLFVVTETNKSAYSHSQPQEASAWYFDYEVDGTTRRFKYGSRATNTVDQWPTPDVYAHSSGQRLSSTEVRNLNRAYPGSPTGTYSEQIAWAITNFIITNNVTMAIDLHEASPEYAVNNAMVYHQDSGKIAASMEINGFNGIFDSGVLGSSSQKIKVEVSAPKLRGLTHRELGDFTGAYVFLFETSNASQGKLHGAFHPELIAYENGYQDKFYDWAWRQTQLYKLSGGAAGIKLLEAPAATLSERVARHTDSITSAIDAFNRVGKTRETFEYFQLGVLDAQPEAGVAVGKLQISGIPSYEDIFVNGVGNYLLPSAR